MNTRQTKVADSFAAFKKSVLSIWSRMDSHFWPCHPPPELSVSNDHGGGGVRKHHATLNARYRLRNGPTNESSHNLVRLWSVSLGTVLSLACKSMARVVLHVPVG